MFLAEVRVQCPRHADLTRVGSCARCGPAGDCAGRSLTPPRGSARRLLTNHGGPVARFCGAYELIVEEVLSALRAAVRHSKTCDRQAASRSRGSSGRLCTQVRPEPATHGVPNWRALTRVENRHGQHLSFSASSAWGVSTPFRLQIDVIPRWEQSFRTPHAAALASRARTTEVAAAVGEAWAAAAAG
jgi:hypothetical protein